MDLSPEQIEEINQALRKLEGLDPAELPGPAAELVDILSRLLEESDQS